MNRVSTFGKRISTRLALLLTLALLPLGLISLYQTQQVIQDAQDVTRASLMSETVSASHAGRELIQQALGAAQGLGAAVMDMPVEQCNTVMQDFVAEHDTFSFASLISPGLQTDCNSAATPTDVSQSPTILAAVDANRPYVDFTIRGTYSGEAVTIAVHPVMRDGAVVGLISISIPHRIISALIEEASSVETVRIATINSNGDIVVSNDTVRDAQGFLPRDISNKGLAELSNETFEAMSADGERRLYAVSSVLPQSVVMVGSWPVESGASVIGGLQSSLALVFPIVMWAAGIAVAYVGLQRLVIRHVSGLRSAMRRFALGDRTVAALTLDDPPEELAEAARAFSRMALIISEAEIRQQKDLQDKEVLLKEVHHRVKNNLQLIVSIMNMEMRNAETPEARRMLRGLQRRVRGLATLHRTLYASPDMTTIDGGELVRAVVEDVAQVSLPSEVELTVDVITADLYPDQAVPLSMLSAEALTNAVKYVGRPADGANPWIRVTLERLDGDHLRLRIANTKGAPIGMPEDESPNTSGLGTRLMKAFVMQVEGEARVDESDDYFVYDVVFSRREFANDAERRRAAA